MALLHPHSRKLGCLLTVQICLFEVYWEVHKGGVTRKSGAPNPNATKAAVQQAVHVAHFIMLDALHAFFNADYQVDI